MWTYDQSSGELRDGTGKLVSRGYSGHGRGKNNPSLQGVKGVGPIPRGRWKMQSIYDSANVGPRAITLWSLDDATIDDRHEATGRSAQVRRAWVQVSGAGTWGLLAVPARSE